jgi:hypothetical protein
MFDQKKTLSKRDASMAIWGAVFLLFFTVSYGFFFEAEASPASLDYQGRHTALSLRVLSKEAGNFLLSHSSLPDTLATLCRIREFEGFVVDAENGDVIVVGREAGQGSFLHLDDLVVGVRSVWKPGIEPVFCSLDPRREDVLAIKQLALQADTIQSPEKGRQLIEQVKAVWGSQLIRIGGVPKDSRYAHIMIDADCHLKKACLGAQKISGLDSYLDIKVSQTKKRLMEGKEGLLSGVSFNRFWFSVQKEYPTFLEQEGIVWLEACPIILLTEKQLDSLSGALYDAEEDDPVAIAFAERFSDQFPSLAGRVAPYAALRNLYLLKSVLEALRYRQGAERAGLNLGVFLDQYACKTDRHMPNSAEGCAVSQEAFFKEDNGTKTYWYFPVNFGGVTMEMEITEQHFRKHARLKRFRSRVLDARPSPEALFWYFTIP